MSGLADVLQQAAGLGLAGAKALGGVAARGLGMAPPPETGMFGAPEQAKPADLSDLSFQQNPLGNVLMRVQNAIASSQGQPLASQVERQNRTQGNEQRVKAFNEGLGLLQQFDAIRQKAMPGDFERVDGLLKKRFAEVAGGKPGEADQFYDAFMSGGAGQTAGLLKLVAGDAGAQQLIASGGTVADLHKYVADKSHEGIILGDQQELPIVRQKLEAILSGQGFTPEQRAKLEALKSDGGRWTLDSLRDANAELPPELQMNAGEWAIAKRHEGDLVSMKGLETTPEILEQRKAGMNSANKQAEDAARIKAEVEGKIKEIEATAKNKSPSRFQAMPGDAAYTSAYQSWLHGGMNGPAPVAGPDVSSFAIDHATGRMLAQQGQQNQMEKFHTPRGRIEKALDDTSQVLTSLDSIGEGLPNWTTGVMRTRADAAAWWLSANDPQRAALNTRMKLLVDQYRMSVTGQAAGEKELKNIEGTVPNPNDNPETATAKLAEFDRYFRNKFQQHLATGRSSQYDVGAFENMAKERGWLTPVSSLADKPMPGSAAAGGAVVERTLKDGTKVRVRQRPDGHWEQVK